MSEGNGTQRELGEIQATLRAIQADQADAKTTRRQMYEKMDAVRDEVRQVKADVGALKSSVEDMAPTVADYRATKAKGLGILAGAALAGGGATTLISKALSKLGLGG